MKPISNRIIRYVLAGVIAYLAEMASLYGLVVGLHLAPVLAAAIGFWVGFGVAFILQKYFAFQNKQRRKIILARQLTYYSVLVLWNYTFTLVAVALLTPKLSVFLVRTMVVLLVTIWNYLLYRYIFKEVDSMAQDSRCKILVWPRLSGPIVFAAGCVLVLLATTGFWAYMGAKVNQANADQLVNSFLFESAGTFHGSFVPGAHTFLFKWPLFWLVNWLGASEVVFVSMTVLICLITVGVLAFILHRIERRPMVFGVLCLSLTSVLLLIPAQPYAGGLLPVSMAMLTTRNLEYIVYLLVLFMLAKVARRQDWRMACGAMSLLTVLIASDKLFATLSVGGALLAMCCYAILRRWPQLRQAGYWLIASILSTLFATGLLWLIDALGIVHITMQTNSNPYGFIHSFHQLFLGIAYGLLSIITNFGANPAYDVTSLFAIPRLAFARLLSPAGFGYLVNAAAVIAAAAATLRVCYVYLFKPRIHSQKSKAMIEDRWQSVALMLIWSSVVALGAFIVTDHSFSVDARYVSITLFTLCVGGAVFVARCQIGIRTLVWWGAIAVIASLSGLFGAVDEHHHQQAALDSTVQRNSKVVDILQAHHVDTLVGNYWRVVPIKARKTDQRIVPLGDCTTYRDNLSSKAWQVDLRTKSFAYLLTLDSTTADFPQCSLAQIVSAYGRPNQSVAVAGKIDQPKELLLFFDHGSQAAPITPTSGLKPTTVVPKPLNNLTLPNCPSGRTVMNFVAHQDDDLLFMNPDLMHTIKEGQCVRSVYLTAGDAGATQYYWLERELGTKDAYDLMDEGTKDLWLDRIVQVGAHQHIIIATPKDNARISLIFMRLADGNLHGEGFSATGHESLQRLEQGKIASTHSVDDSQSSYSEEELVRTLTLLMNAFKPNEIRTQANDEIKAYTDHSDHLAVGRYVQKALAQYAASDVSVKYYQGYPVHLRPQNIFDSDLQQKEALFFAYARHDSNTCTSVQLCAKTAYAAYLKRQYVADH